MVTRFGWIHGLLVRKRWTKKQKDAFRQRLEPPKDNQPWPLRFRSLGNSTGSGAMARRKCPEAIPRSHWEKLTNFDSTKLCVKHSGPNFECFLRVEIFTNSCFQGMGLALICLIFDCRKKSLYRNSWVGQTTQDIGGNQCKLHTMRLGFFKTNDLFLKNIYKTVSCSDS